MAAASRTGRWKGILSATRSSALLKALILHQLTRRTTIIQLAIA